jgi:hypothetical protein
VGWDRRGYYYRVRKVGGRVVREYCGSGRAAELLARRDALERERREQDRLALRLEKAHLDALDADCDTLNDIAQLVAHAALLAAGYHQHKRGQWRKRRGEPVNTEGRPADDRAGNQGAGEAGQ